MKRMLFYAADESKRHARAAAGVFDDCATGLQASVCLWRLDHGERHAVLHAACRVLALEFEENPGAVGWHDIAQSQKRSVADRVEDCFGRLCHCGLTFEKLGLSVQVVRSTTTNLRARELQPQR